MKTSGSSSATATRPRSAPPRRSGFALSGRSHPVDPRVDAVRRDLADVRLADRVFAPHYAAPMRRMLATGTALHETREPGSAILADLAAGDAFDLLDVTGDLAWGVAVGAGLVGYLRADAMAAA